MMRIQDPLAVIFGVISMSVCRPISLLEVGLLARAQKAGRASIATFLFCSDLSLYGRELST